MNNCTYFAILLLLFLGIAVHNMYRLNRARKDALNRLHHLVTRNLAGELLTSEQLTELTDLSKTFEQIKNKFI